MRADLYEEMYYLEESYWWHVAKRELVKMFLDKYLTRLGHECYVDVGCGTGKLLEEIKHKKWELAVGIDGADEALRFCYQRKHRQLIKADFESKLPVKNETVDVITCLDVVEHVQHDQLLLIEFGRVLKKDGLAIITVPAYKWLWTYWDDVLGHKRRYRIHQLRSKLKKAGLKIEHLSYFYSYLVPIAILFRIIKSVIPRARKKSDFMKLPNWLNEIGIWLFRMETKLFHKTPLPFGLSLVCVVRKI